MSNAILPLPIGSLNGQTWDIIKRPLFQTKIQQSVSMRETRAAFANYPQWRWTLHWEFLRAGTTGIGTFTELQTLLNFFLARQGSYDSFLYNDLSDNTATSQVFGTGDGVTTAFQLVRSLVAGGFNEPIYNTNSTPVIKDNGVTKTAGVDYNIGATGIVTFTAPPVAAHSLTWSGTYYWRCRFDGDDAAFANFVQNFWELKEISIVSILGS